MRTSSNREKIIRVFIVALLLFVAALGMFFLYQSGLLKKDPEVEIRADNSYSETLKVVMGEYYPPFSFIKDGEYTGHDVELANELANRLGMNLETEYLTWSECLDAVQSGRADMVMSVDYEYPEAGMVYTIPVADNPWMAFSKGDVRSYAGLYGKRIGIGENTDALEDPSFTENYVVFDSYEPAFDALEKGEVDVVITKYPVGTYIADKKGYKDISATCELAGGHFAVGVREDSVELLERLNGVILDMSNDGTLSRLSGKWFGTFVKNYSLMDILGLHPEYFLIGAAVILIMLALISALSIRESASRKEIALRDAEEAGRLIDSVTSAYHIAYQVNMAEDSFRLLRMESTLIDESQIASFGSFSEVIDGLSSIIHPDEREHLLNELKYDNIRKKLESAKSYSVEYRVLIDGVTSWHMLNITKIDEDSFAIGFAERDMEITMRRIEDKRFGECFALFAVDIDTEMIKVLKNEERYQVCRVGESTPYTPFMQGISQSLSAEPKEFFIRMSDLDYVKKEFASGDKLSYAYKSIQFAGDKWIDMMSYCILRHDDGTPSMFTLAFSIVDALGSERQALQDRIAAQSRQLENALSMAQAASRAKSDFLFNMSHDIRTPMNAITGFTAMARKYIDDKDAVSGYLDKISSSGKQLLSLINSVLEMARIESGMIELEEKPVNVREKFNSMTTVLSEQAQLNGLVFRYSLEDVRHFNVLADESKVDSIMLNIAGNAMKYTPEGGSVDFILREIGDAKPGYAKFLLTVADTGIGMSKEFLKTLFNPFVREKTSTVSGIQGTGLGTSIVKRFVDLMDGDIEVQSEPDKGTRFDITFNLRIGEETAGDSANIETERTVSFSGCKTLLVEDNELNREIAKDILESEGLAVECAGDGSEAVEIMREKGADYYDFILMDIQMPVMNGYEATKAIRDMYPGADIPIIALSANAFEEDREASKDAGMNDHVAKPIDTAELFGALAKYI